MASTSLNALNEGLVEIEHLLSADPTPLGGLSPKPDVTRAILRSAVVLLSSHYERYIRSVTEEAVTLVNRSSPRLNSPTLIMKLEHTRVGVEAVISKNWENREQVLKDFVNTDAWLWNSSLTGTLDHKRLLIWMKSPDPKRIMRAYKLWGIEDIFKRITRSIHTRNHFFRQLRGLVDKRNNIAHGDFSAEATRVDLEAYLKTVQLFCSRADAALGRILQTRFGINDAWQDAP